MKKGLRKAVIDCGTNTFHLLIVQFKDEKNYTILHQEKVAVKIGVNGIQKNIINTEATKRALQTLLRFSETIKHHNVSDCLATATSAFRNATNGTQLVESVYKTTGISINIISGPQEALLIHKGVLQAVEPSSQYNLIIDIGGGSVEFILCDQTGVKWLKSFEIGGIRLYEKFHQNDPIPETDIKRLNDYLDEELSELFTVCTQYSPQLLIGASGSFDTLSEIYAKEHNIPFDEDNNLSFNLPVDSTLSIINKLVALPRDKRMEIKGMIPLRVDLIVVAGLLVKKILHELPLKEILTTGYALKEGLIYTTTLRE